MAAMKSRGLGKGLEALFNDITINTQEISEATETLLDGQISLLDVNLIKPNNNQPRKTFNDEKTEELAKSIENYGIIQPIIVRSVKEGYEIVAGERRWRAARKASLKKVPCLIRELDEKQNMLFSIIENMQREDLNPIEEAKALQELVSVYGFTQEDISRNVGKSRPYVTNALRLLRLPEGIQEMLVNQLLSSGHARAILAVKDEKTQMDLAKHAVRENLSVRELERIVNKKISGLANPKPKSKERVDAKQIKSIEEELKSIVGTKVRIHFNGKKGKIELEYYSKDELERLIDLLNGLKH